MNKHPELDALLKQVEGYVMTKEEKEAQRQSWFVGEVRMLHPEMKREEAIERYKVASGRNVLEDKEVNLAEVQAENERLKETYKEDGQELAQFQSKQIELLAHNLQLVGALENIMTQGSKEFFHARALRGMARAALSGDDIEKYRTVLEKVDALRKAFDESMGALSREPYVTVQRELFESIAALQSGEPTTKEVE